MYFQNNSVNQQIKSLFDIKFNKLNQIFTWRVERINWI